MLTISRPLSSGQACSYHDREFTNSEQNYYSQKGAVERECVEGRRGWLFLTTTLETRERLRQDSPIVEVLHYRCGCIVLT